MSKDVSAEHDRPEDKVFGKQKWRGKLFPKEGWTAKGKTNHESTDNDVAQFLQTSIAEADERSQNLSPRTDSAEVSRWPSGAPDFEPGTGGQVYSRPNIRKNKGLRVRFRSEAPVVIGEGGDEAELPAIYVSTPASDPEDNPSFRSPSLRRKPTLIQHSGQEGQIDPKSSPESFAPVPSIVESSRKSEQLTEPPIYTLDNVRFFPSEAVESSKSRQRPPSPYSTSSDTLSFDASDANPEGNVEVSSSSQLASPDATLSAGYSLTPAVSPPPISQHENVPKPRHESPFTELSNRSPSRQTNADDPETQEGVQKTSAPPVYKPLSLRGVVRNLGTDALDEFDVRVRRLNSIFRLGASAHQDVMEVSFVQWIRSAVWWFLKGRGELETAVRGMRQGVYDPPRGKALSSTVQMSQAHVDLAKAWWIVKEVTPSHPEITKYGDASIESLVAVIGSFGDQALADLVEIHLGIIANMRALTMSMKRNNRLPPLELEITRLNTHILPELMILPPEIAILVSNHILKSSKDKKSFFPIPIGDTDRHFSFGRMFVNCSIISREKNEVQTRVSCVLSVLRGKSELDVKAVIVSQDGQVEYLIQQANDTTSSKIWKDIEWKLSSFAIAFALSPDLEIHVQLSENDFKILWGICDYTRKVRRDFAGHVSENLVLESVLRDFQCLDSRMRGSFPPERVKDCSLRLFEKSISASDGTAREKTYDGYRLTIRTPSYIKSLSSVNFDFGTDAPVLFGHQQGDKGPTLLLRGPESPGMLLSFSQPGELGLFRSTIDGSLITKTEHSSTSLVLLDLHVEGLDSSTLSNTNARVGPVRWLQLRVIQKKGSEDGKEQLTTARPETLRIIAECEDGICTDRVSHDPGELQMSLSVDNLNEIRLIRPPRHNSTWAFADERLSAETIDYVSSTIQKSFTKVTTGTYKYRSLSDLHSFQTMLTGFTVTYDGIASNFAISRRRAVVGINKRWETGASRIQLLKKDRTIQLVSFFKDFSHGGCINFNLKTTDVFETLNRSGTFCLRIVDAKFALPKGEGDPTWEFVCLDTAEYPSEHDDVVIAFEGEEERNKFVIQLPAAVKQASRMGSLGSLRR